nr:DUF4192 domain-containing protein [Micromonospora sp. NBC_00855]
MVAPRTLRLTSRDDIVVAVPYLLGFHPTDSLVCIALDERRIPFVARLDLPEPSALDDFAPAAAHTAALLARYASAVILVGYGPAERVAPASAALTTELQRIDVGVPEVLRVADGRYWCLCGAPACAAGVAYDPSGSSVPAEAVYLGIAPLPDRAALRDLITPVTGPPRTRMRAATETALRRLAGMLTDGRDPTAAAGQPPSSPPEQVVTDGVTAVRQAYECAVRGDVLSDDEVAWLTVVLMVPEVRDHAWVTGDGSDAQRRLWTDVTRRATPGLSAAPACLLAVTAYLDGDGALARIGIDRALDADPDYRLAHLLAEALRAGVPPQVWQAAITGTTTD